MKMLPLFILVLLIGCQKDYTVIEKTGTIKITFKNKIKTDPLILGTTTYTNSFGEQYNVTKFKYYISNVAIINANKKSTETESYHLIDENNPSSLSFNYTANVNKYDAIVFTIGVDSLRNVSGAQTGALDPANDMFWTWSTGYIMAKMEGSSPQSTAVNNKIEYHIGGFTGVNNVLKKITLTFPSGKYVDIKEDKISEIIIETDLDKWWQNPTDIKIANNPICTTPGVLSKQIADNYSKMFLVADVINN